jgi:hypothetical protein
MSERTVKVEVETGLSAEDRKPEKVTVADPDNRWQWDERYWTPHRWTGNDAFKAAAQIIGVGRLRRRWRP